MQELWQSIKLKSVFKYSIAAVLLVIPLYPKFPVIVVPGTYVAIRAEDFLLSFLGLIYVAYFIKTDKKKFFRDPIHLAIILYTFIGLISVISGVFLTKTISLSIGLLHWTRRIEYMVPFFVSYAVVKMGVNTKYYLHLLLLVGLLAFLYGFGQEHFGFPVITTQNEEYSKGIALMWVPGARLPSTFAGQYDLAAFFVLIFPLLAAYYFYLKTKLQRIGFLLFFFLPCYWLFLQTEARVSFVAYLIGVSLTLWVLKKKKLIIPLIGLSIIGMLLFSSLGSRYLRVINAYKSRITGQSVEIVKKVYAAEPIGNNANFAQAVASDPNEDRSFSIRTNVEWPRAIRAFTKNPILGTGYSSITLATDNDYLRLLGEVGLAGALSFLVIQLQLILGVKRYLQDVNVNLTIRKIFVAGFLGGFVGFLLNAAFIDVFEASKVAIIFWTLAGIAISVVKTHEAKNK